MTKTKKKRITILVDSLSTGGAEKSAATLSHLLYDANYKVSIISIQDKIIYNFSGNLINIGKDVSSIKLIKYNQKIKRLRRALYKENPDYILDYRMRNRPVIEYILHKFVFSNYKMVFTNHNYFTDYHLPRGSYFIKAYNNNIVTAVSKDIKKKLETTYNLNNVYYLPNAVDQEALKNAAIQKKIDGNYIIAIGRLYNEVKQFDKLIETYSTSQLPKKGIKLYILGEGKDKVNLINLVEKLGMTNFIDIMGFIDNPYPYIKQAKFLVLNSKFEGLPMVILEALALKTPVVSFDCKSGPSEMIAHNQNGILVKNQDFNALKKAMNYLIDNDTILDEMRTKTTINFKNYTLEQHLNYWKKILN